MLLDKLKKDVNKFLLNQHIADLTQGDNKIDYKTFKELMQALGYVNKEGATPGEMGLVSEMWEKELGMQGEDKAHTGNVICLLAGVERIKVKEILVDN